MSRNIYSDQVPFFKYLGDVQRVQNESARSGLERRLLEEQIAQHEAKTQALLDPRTQEQNLPAAVRTHKYYAGLDEAGRRSFEASRRAPVEEALMRRGLLLDPSRTQVTGMGNYAQTLADQAAQQAEAQQAVKMQTEPQIQRAISEAKLQQQLQYEPQIAAEKKQVAMDVEKRQELRERQAMLPELEQAVQKLGELGETATYTKAGQALDFAKRELGLRVGQGAIDRAEFISRIDNQILPLLKQTFGAAFTEKEGRDLRATMGNPDLSPPEKMAVLEAFIEQKRQSIMTKERELGMGAQEENLEPPVKNKKIDGYWFLGGDPADPNNYREVK